ncbi:hypothetical protein LHJ74_23885 [Streptomyces sp. N2-109]|uniref:DUF4352 domain-containing protein n=1 Tax=Streptomyces gossypii TaxID=2883101 RepID=A0ABT2JYZ7_9ACTN|nr:hypothetical protein [Streptomyces gossypii]MCT2592916.1 hypothetical protein [Streptomyces gossypii]
MSEPDSRTITAAPDTPADLPVPSDLAEPSGTLRSALRSVLLVLGSVLLVLAVVVAVALHELQEDIDAAGGPELNSPGGFGEPLSAGNTARYKDGVKLKLSALHRAVPAFGDGAREPGDRTYLFSLTYENGGDEPLAFGPDHATGFDFWAGTHAEEDALLEGAPDWENGEETEALLPGALEPGRSLTLPLRYTLAEGVPVVTFSVELMDGREPVYWEIPVDDLTR